MSTLNLIPNHNFRITSLKSTTNCETTVSLGGEWPVKEDPSLPYREGGGSGDYLPGSQSCMPNHIAGMAEDT